MANESNAAVEKKRTSEFDNTSTKPEGEQQPAPKSEEKPENRADSAASDTDPHPWFLS